MQSGDMKHIRPLELDPGLTAIKEEEGILSSLPPWRNEDLFLNSLHTLLIISKDFRGDVFGRKQIPVKQGLQFYDMEDSFAGKKRPDVR